jgi:carbamoyl-phosphate synthase large subunit
MKTINLMFLGGGKRVSLARSFKASAKILGIHINLFSYEIDMQQPIGLEAKIIVGRRWADSDLINDLCEVIQSYNIDLLVANVDPATRVIATLKERYHCAQISSDQHLIDMCISKKKLQLLCEEKGIKCIPLASNVEFPCFVKPDYGSASVGARLIASPVDLADAMKGDPTLIVQKFMDGKEYTVDCYISKQGVICGISPRERVATAGGEVVISKTLRNKALINLSTDIIKKLAFIGAITLQFIVDKKASEIYLMEINPRFGGGVIASIESGFNYPLMMLQDTLNEEPIVVRTGKEIIMKRYFEEVFYANSN